MPPHESFDVATTAALIARLVGRAADRSSKLEAGRLVLLACYRGSAEAMAERGRATGSVRRLAATPGVALSPTTLWRYARAHAAAESLGPALAGPLSVLQLARLAGEPAGPAREAEAARLACRAPAGRARPGGDGPGPRADEPDDVTAPPSGLLRRAHRVLDRLELLLPGIDEASLAALASRLHRLAAQCGGATVAG